MPPGSQRLPFAESHARRTGNAVEHQEHTRHAARRLRSLPRVEAGSSETTGQTRASRGWLVKMRPGPALCASSLELSPRPVHESAPLSPPSPAFACVSMTVGCRPVKYRAVFQRPTLELRTATEASNAGAGEHEVRVRAVTLDELPSFPLVGRRLFWREPERDQPSFQSRDPDLARINQRDQFRSYGRPHCAPVALVPLPAFEIRIQNRGTEPLVIGAVELEEPTGKVSPLLTQEVEFAHHSELAAWSKPRFGAISPGTVEWLRREAHGVPFLQEGQVVPPGATWRAFAAFDLRTVSLFDYYEWMRGIEKLTLRVSTSSSDAASRYEFVKRVEPIEVECPGDAREPSLERCDPVGKPRAALCSG